MTRQLHDKVKQTSPSVEGGVERPLFLYRAYASRVAVDPGSVYVFYRRPSPSVQREQSHWGSTEARGRFCVGGTP
jgi:hypothetical protein